jgi:cbb3-type cytochrome oxidase maturation protein
MSVLYVALPVALALASLAVAAFAFSVRGGQFDDLETPPVRMLFDDPPAFF